MANSLSTRLDRDKLFLLPRDAVAQDAQLVLEPLKNFSGERLVASTAVAFAVVCERAGMTPQELHAYGKRILHGDQAFHKKGNDTLEALRDFAALRMRNNPII